MAWRVLVAVITARSKPAFMDSGRRDTFTAQAMNCGHYSIALPSTCITEGEDVRHAGGGTHSLRVGRQDTMTKNTGQHGDFLIYL